LLLLLLHERGAILLPSLLLLLGKLGFAMHSAAKSCAACGGGPCKGKVALQFAMQRPACACCGSPGVTSSATCYKCIYKNTPFMMTVATVVNVNCGGKRMNCT